MALENEYGELGLDATLQQLAIVLNQLNNALSLAKDPGTGRLRVMQDGAGTTQATTISSGTVTTVTTVSNMSALNAHGNATGPLAAQVAAQAPAWAMLQGPADSLRSKIVVS